MIKVTIFICSCLSGIDDVILELGH